MWDVDDSGSINVVEMTNIIATMDDLEGVEQEPKVITDQLQYAEYICGCVLFGRRVGPLVCHCEL